MSRLARLADLVARVEARFDEVTAPRLAKSERLGDIHVNPSRPALHKLIGASGGMARFVRSGHDVAVAPSFKLTHMDIVKGLKKTAHPMYSDKLAEDVRYGLANGHVHQVRSGLEAFGTRGAMPAERMPEGLRRAMSG